MNQPIAGVTARFRRLSALTAAAILAAASLAPLLYGSSVSAAQLTDRDVTISTSESDATGVQYDISIDFTATDVEGLVIEFCTAPLGTCTLPSSMDVRYGNVAISHTGFPNNGTSFVEQTTDVGDCNDVSANDDTETMYCASRTEATSAAGDDAVITLTGIENPTANDTVYIRVGLYDDSGYTSRIHEGTVAAAIVDQLTVNGRVQERLDFCVAAIDDGDALGTVATDVATCAAVVDQNVDLGVIDESSVAVAPVDADPDTGSDDDYGILMVNTNATNGTTLSYFAEDPTSVLSGDTHQLKSFRVVPADCDASAASTTDQCFVSADGAGTGTVITQGTELFGMYVPCVDGTQGTTNNITIDSNYDGNDDTITEAADCENEAFASGTAVLGWNSSTTADTIGSAATTIDNEIVKLRFAATANATTPSGNYTVTTTYIATANF